MTGYNKVAKVKFINGPNPKKNYVFALYDDAIEVGDIVLCDTSLGYSGGRVTHILNKDECTTVPTKEILCKCDLTSYESRVTRRELRQATLERLRKEMNDREPLMLELLSHMSPELKDLYDVYQQMSEHS